MMNDLWEGYDNQDVVLLEDIDPFHVKLGYNIKIWADRYAFRGRVLYGSIVLRPKVIVITSQYHPRDIWGSDSKTTEAILDRFRVRKIERMMDVDNTPSKKKKPALIRARPLSHSSADSICLACYMSPCMCDMIEPGYLLSEVTITDSDDENEKEKEIVID